MDNLVFSNMLHRPARTIVSVFGIAVGVLLIIFTVGLANGTLRENARREQNVGAEIMVRSSGTFGLSGSESFRLPIADVEEIGRIEGVKLSVPIGQNLVTAKDNNFGTRLVDGIEFDTYSQLSGIRVVAGRSFAEKGDETMMDTAWLESRNLKVGDTFKIYDRDFAIVGAYEPAVGGGRVKIPLATMQEQLGSEGKCTAAMIKVSDVAQQEAVAERISGKFPDNQIVFTKDLEEIYSNSIPALNVFLNVVIGVAAIVSGLVILLTMYTTVTERTRQIGVLKSLGMSKIGIAWIITQEALLLSFLGVVVGVLLTLLLRVVIMKTTTMNVVIEPRWLLITLALGLVGGAVGALYPAIRAARLDAVEALSYE